jgi:hypothetical protein
LRGRRERGSEEEEEEEEEDEFLIEIFILFSGLNYLFFT